MGDSNIDEEIEVLQSIYLEDLTVSRNEGDVALEITLHPATADNEEERYVCMTLELHMDSQYPAKMPEIIVKNPRGISEAHINSIIENASALAEQKIGDAMIFELIEYAKDCLTDNNRPSCICTICLEHFQDSDEFTRTECYHYFHSFCLKNYFTTHKNEASNENSAEGSENSNKFCCPVCRLPVEFDTNKFLNVTPPASSEKEVKFSPSAAYLQWKNDMKKIFERQRKAGGIIDIETERNKFFIEITNIVPSGADAEDNEEENRGSLLNTDSNTSSQLDVSALRERKSLSSVDEREAKNLQKKSQDNCFYHTQYTSSKSRNSSKPVFRKKTSNNEDEGRRYSTPSHQDFVPFRNRDRNQPDENIGKSKIDGHRSQPRDYNRNSNYFREPNRTPRYYNSSSPGTGRSQHDKAHSFGSGGRSGKRHTNSTRQDKGRSENQRIRHSKGDLRTVRSENDVKCLEETTTFSVPFNHSCRQLEKVSHPSNSEDDEGDDNDSIQIKTLAPPPGFKDLRIT